MAVNCSADRCALASTATETGEAWRLTSRVKTRSSIRSASGPRTSSGTSPVWRRITWRRTPANRPRRAWRWTGASRSGGGCRGGTRGRRAAPGRQAGAGASQLVRPRPRGRQRLDGEAHFVGSGDHGSTCNAPGRGCRSGSGRFRKIVTHLPGWSGHQTAADATFEGNTVQMRIVCRR